MRKYLVEMRRAVGITQKTLATKLNISESYVCLIENGERQTDMKMSFLQQISEVLDVSIDELIKAEQDYQEGLKQAG